MHQMIGRDGRRRSYLDSSPGGGVSNVVVFLHAFPLAAEMWAAQLSALPQGWRGLAPDARGFGSSDPDDEAGVPTIDDYAADLLALLDHLGIPSAVVAGLSMGGYTALATCRLAPERVKALVLADTRAEADSGQARANRDAMLERIARDGTAPVVEGMLPTLLGRTTHERRHDIVERIRRLALGQSVAGVRGALERLKGRPDATPQLASMACPALVVVGDEDVLSPLDVARGLAQRIPGAVLSVVEGAGHLSNVEQPDRFNAALDAFLGGLR